MGGGTDKLLLRPIVAHVPVHVVSVANVREHWSVRARRANKHRWSAYWALLAVRAEAPAVPLVVTLTRLQPPRGRHMDGDNLQMSLKAVRDGVAEYLEIDDGSSGIEWKYAQRRADIWGCEILIEEKSNVV
jgi:hypothetical protein